MVQFSGSLIHLRRMAARTRAASQAARDRSEAASLALLASDLDAEADEREHARRMVEAEED